jgi:uncharacterized protein DUF1707/cell wall-active antibiotic response 4TMS protein YvqF
MNEPAVLASDAERERAVELMRRGSVDGRLTLEEFAQRMSAAYEARTREELDELTRDLPAESAALPSPRRAAGKWIVAVMGGAHRRGRFRLGARTNVITIMGGANLDLRQAELEGPEVTITVLSVMGGANLIVPEGVDVELTGLSIMGGKNYRPGKQRLPPNAPVVRVRGYSVMGGISVVTKPS